jgi:hypothetical protein
MQGLAKLGAYAVQRPGMILQLLKFWAGFLKPHPGGTKQSEHDYDDDLVNGVQYLLSGLDPATRATFQHYPASAAAGAAAGAAFVFAPARAAAAAF